jgi:hypothetical protein
MMLTKKFPFVACAVFVATLGAGSALAAGQDHHVCAGVDTRLSPSRTQEYTGLVAAAVGKTVKPSQVEIIKFLTSGSWSAVYASTPVADPGYLFFQEVDGKKQFRDAWGGMAQSSDRPELIAWAKKLGAPESLAACFADTAIGE